MSTQTVTTSGSGLIFQNTYSLNCTQQYINCIVQAEQQLQSLFTNPLTLNISFDAVAAGSTGYVATNKWSSSVNVSYAQLISALPPSDGLPISDPTGGHSWSIPVAYARMLGLSTSTPSVDDTVTLNTSFNFSYGQDAINAIQHEISEGAMGRVGGLGDQNNVWSTLDLFRYSAPGVRDFTDGRDGQTTYFSANGSSLSSLSFNNEYNFGSKANTGDTGDFAQQDVFGWTSSGETNTLSQTDIAVFNALGWNHSYIAPILTGQGFSVSPNQSVAVSSHLSLSNPSSDSVTTYWIEDLGGGSGHLTIGGIVQANSQWIQTSSNWGNVQYVGGSTPGIDALEVAIYDSTTSNFIYSSNFNATTVHVAPTITCQFVPVSPNQSVSISSALSVSNPTGDSLTSYWIEDLGGGTGHVNVGGVSQPNLQWVQTNGNWSNVQYLGGPAAGVDALEVAVYDSTTASFVYSSPFSALTSSVYPFTGDATSQIETVYIAYFGRAGDAGGMSYWATQLNSGALSLQGEAASFSLQNESKAQYPFLANPLTASTAGVGNALDSFINSVYGNLFGRVADGSDTSGGLGYWRGQILNALATHDSSVVAQELGVFCLQVAFGAQGTDQTCLQNKVTVADFITQLFSTNNIIVINGNTAFSFMQTDIASVTSSASSVTAAESSVVGIIPSLPHT